MMLLLLLTLTSLLLTGGGWARSTCPPPCSCEDVQKSPRVTCVEVGLRSVPTELSSVTSSLDLSVNELTELSAHNFARLHRLRELFLHNNRLRRVSSEAFHNLKKLRSLRLDANFLSRLPAASFRGLSSLCHLWLDENVLTEVPVIALRVLTELQALSLALNTISHVPDRAFASLDQLLVLHLHGNRIHSVGRRSFDGLKNLEMLDLSFNRIDRFPAAIRHLSHLRDLNLQNNYIPVLPENAFTGNPSLLSINIRNNPVHTVGHLPLRLLSDPLSLSLRGSIFSHFTERKTETLMLDVVPLCDQSVESSSSSPPRTTHEDSLLRFNVSFIFFISVLLNLLVLLSFLLLSSVLTPSSSSSFSSSLCLLAALFWFHLLTGLCGSIILSTDGFWGSHLETVSGVSSFLFFFCLEVCVLVTMVAGFRSRPAGL